MTTTTQANGPSWLDLRPEHFDRSRLPRKHRNAPEGLFSVVDVLPEQSPAPAVTPELNGQGELFGDLS